MIKFKVRRGDIDFRECEVARVQFFACASMTSVTFTPNYLRFSSNCVRKFGSAEYIELLVHPNDNLCAARPCHAENKNAMRWSTARGGKIYGREISGAAFLGTLYDLFNWNRNYKYRLRGEILYFGGERAALFDISEPEVLISKTAPECKSDETSLNLIEDGLYIAAQTKRTFTALPLSWESKDRFGKNYYSYKSMRLPNMPIGNLIASYDNQPGLHPTAPALIEGNVRQLLTEIQNNGEI